MSIEIEVVIALQELVGKLCEGQSRIALCTQTFLHGVLGHHVVYGDVLTDVADESEERIVLHPVVVVHEFGGVGRIAVEVEELGQLLTDAVLIVSQRLLVQEYTLGRLHRGVAYHPCGSSYESDGAMAGALEVP